MKLVHEYTNADGEKRFAVAQKTIFGYTRPTNKTGLALRQSDKYSWNLADWGQFVDRLEAERIARRLARKV